MDKEKYVKNSSRNHWPCGIGRQFLAEMQEPDCFTVADALAVQEFIEEILG